MTTPPAYTFQKVTKHTVFIFVSNLSSEYYIDCTRIKLPHCENLYFK